MKPRNENENENVNFLTGILAKWTRETPLADIRIMRLRPVDLKKEDHKIRFIIAIQQHLKLLQQYERLNVGNNSPLSKAILQATDHLRKAVETINSLTKDKLFDNIDDAFAPINASMQQAIEIAPLLNKINEDPDAKAIYENGTQLASTLLERANSNFMFVFNDAKNTFNRIGKAGSIIDGDNTPIDEMKSLKEILVAVNKNGQNRVMNQELQKKIDAHKTRVGSTASLYWDKLIESISDYMGKKIGTRLSTRTKATYFNEKILANTVVKSISAFYKKQEEKKKEKKDIELSGLNKNPQGRR